jgi:glutathione S-transferase
LCRYVDQCIELIEEHVKQKQLKAEGPAKEAHQKHLEEEHVPKLLRMFEQRLQRTGASHLVPSGLTIADIYLFHAVEWLGSKKDHFLAHHPNVKRLVDNLREHEDLSAYLDKRPETHS